MNDTSNEQPEHQRKKSDRRTARGRRASDQDNMDIETVEEADVPQHRRRKSVRRSGLDRRNPPKA